MSYHALVSSVEPASALMRTIFKFAFVAAMAAAVAACGPRDHRNNNQYNNQPNQGVSQDFGGRHHGGKLRRICANDIQKLCSGQQKVRRCLRDNSDKLEPACNTALQQAIERRRERKMRQMNNTNTQTQGQQPTQQNGMQPQTPAAPQNGMQPQNNNTNQQHNKSSNDDDDDDD
jgi:hypothetical protein